MSYGSEEDQRAGRIAVGIVLALVVAGCAWWWWSRGDDAAEPTEQVASLPEPPPFVPMPIDDTPPPIQHPIQAPAVEQQAAPEGPAPDPDVVTGQAFGEVLGPAIAEWLVQEQLARRVVATVDNLPRNARIEPLRPLRPPTGPFRVEREMLDAAVGEERIELSPANFARYDAIVGLVAAVDPAVAAATYRRVYPQLQSSYEDLGYPGRYFNDRVVAVIDHLLATPTPEGPLLLEQPKVLYRFADARLESLSPGQKLLLRIGPAHAQVIRQKLQEFRALVVADSAAN